MATKQELGSIYIQSNYIAVHSVCLMLERSNYYITHWNITVHPYVSFNGSWLLFVSFWAIIRRILWKEIKTTCNNGFNANWSYHSLGKSDLNCEVQIWPPQIGIRSKCIMLPCMKSSASNELHHATQFVF